MARTTQARFGGRVIWEFIMLDVLRKSAAGWIAKLFIGLLVISFAIWGIADIFRGFGGNAVAQVGDTEIPAALFRTTYNRELQTLGRRMNRGLSAEQGVAMGLPGRVLGQLISEAALDEEARIRGLGISDETLARQIREDPNLTGGTGKFDRDSFRRLLANNEMTEDSYIRLRRAEELRQQIAGAITGGVVIPQAYLEAINRYSEEERVIRTITIGPDQVGEIAAPSDDDLTTYFDANKAQFRAPEYRKFSYIVVDPETVARPDDVSEDAIKAAYDAAGTRFKTPEKRRVRQIVFPTKEEADAAAAKIAAGGTFAEIMADRKLTDTDVDLGLVAKSELIDPAVGDAAFALADGAVSPVVKGRFGHVLVTVSDITPEQVQPLADVRDTLAKEIAEKTASRDVINLTNEIEDARAGGATLEEIAKRFSLKLVTVDGVDSSGKAPDKSDVTLPKKADLLKLVFDSDVGIENDPLQLTKGFLWYDVSEVTPARDRTLDEVRDEVVAAWKTQEYNTRVSAKATELLDQVKAGKSLDDVAQEIGVEVKESAALKRQTKDPSYPGGVIAAAFGGPEGHVASATGPDDTRVILVVKSTTPPAFFEEAAGVPELKKALTGQLEASLMTQYIELLQGSLGVKVNQTVLQQSLGLSSR